MDLTNVPNNIASKLNSVIQSTKLHFDELSVFNYVFEEESFDTSLVVPYPINISFINVNLGLKVVVHYEPLDIDEVEIDLIAVDIQKIEDSNDLIDFERFIEKYHSNLNIDLDYLFYVNKGKDGSFSEKVDEVIQLNLKYLIELGEEIICGKEWHNDLKFDWGEYK